VKLNSFMVVSRQKDMDWGSLVSDRPRNDRRGHGQGSGEEEEHVQGEWVNVSCLLSLRRSWIRESILVASLISPSSVGGMSQDASLSFMWGAKPWRNTSRSPEGHLCESLVPLTHAQ